MEIVVEIFDWRLVVCSSRIVKFKELLSFCRKFSALCIED